MNAAWFARPDWPMDWEIERRSELMAAIRALPQGDTLLEEVVEGKALLLWSASNFGRDEELPRNRPASQEASEKELQKLAEVSAQLADLIEAMHRPAVQALWNEHRGDLWTVARQLKELSEAAMCALSGLEVQGSARGAGKKAAAAEVSATAEHIFKSVTGQDAKRKRHFLAFLSAIYKVLLPGTRVSQGWQARLLEKKGSGQAN
jgi:hypothetical protein